MMRQNAFFVIFKELSVARESLRAQSEPLNHWVKSSAFLYWSIRNLLHKTVVDFVKYKFIDSPKFCFYRIDKTDCDKIVYKIFLMIFQCKKTIFLTLYIHSIQSVYISFFHQMSSFFVNYFLNIFTGILYVDVMAFFNRFSCSSFDNFIMPSHILFYSPFLGLLNLIVSTSW